MKKLLLALSALTLFISISCSKDEEPSIFLKEDILGLWEECDGDNFTPCPVGDNPRIEITAKAFRLFYTTDEGCLSLGYRELSYNFDGEVIYSEDGIVTLRVLGANAQNLQVTDGKKNIMYSKITK